MTKVGSLQLSNIILGTAVFGTTVSEEDAEQIIARYLELGGTTINSGRLYGDRIDAPDSSQIGRSEEIIGNFLVKNNLRNKIIITTKIGHPDIHVPDFVHNAPSRINREELSQDLNDSLKALQTDYIDLLCLHRDAPTKPVGEIMEILNDFVAQGKVREIGASNWNKHRIDEANEYAYKHGIKPFSVSEIECSFAHINEEFVGDSTTVRMYGEEREKYLQSDMPIMAYASQASGLFWFAEEYGEEILQHLPAGLMEKYWNKKTIQAIETAKKYARRFGISYTASALKLLLESLPVMAVIGPATVGQVEDSFAAVGHYDE